MPRKNRLWREGLILHITVRGNRKEDIFKSVEDYCVYLRNLHHAINRVLGFRWSFFLHLKLRNRYPGA